MSWFEKNTSTYNAIANHFAETRKGYMGDIATLLAYVKRGDRVLDIGCGSGRLYHFLENIQVAYTGIDPSKEQLRVAKKAYPKARFLLGNMCHLPFLDASFDIVYCIASFHHLEHEIDRMAALQEMHRVLKSGGILLMINWDLLGAWAQQKAVHGAYTRIGEMDYQVPWMNSDRHVMGNRYYHAFTIEEITRLSEAIGFIVQKQYQTSNDRDNNIESERPGNIVSILNKKKDT